MKKKKVDDEIDIIELFQTLLNNKLKVLLIIVLSISLGYIYTMNHKPFYQVDTEIRPISIIDEFQYQTYNSYIKKKSLVLVGEEDAKRLSILNNFKEIEKDFLMSLFINRLIDKSSLNNLLKEANFLNEENYQNSEDYDNAINSISSAIKVYLPEEGRLSSWAIRYFTGDLNKWKKFMIFVDEFLNKEIKEYLEKKFNNQLLTEKKLKEYQIDDLQVEIKNLSQLNENQSDPKSYLDQLNELERAKRMLVANLTANKDIERLQMIFNSTPIIESDDFYAAKIMHKSSKFQNINRTNKMAVILLAGLIGLAIALFYVYILMALRKRNKS